MTTEDFVNKIIKWVKWLQKQDRKACVEKVIKYGRKRCEINVVTRLSKKRTHFHGQTDKEVDGCKLSIADGQLITSCKIYTTLFAFLFGPSANVTECET